MRMLLFALLVGLWVTMLLLRWVWVGYYASRIWTPPRGLTQRSCYLCLTTVPGRIGSLHGRLEALASLPCHHGLVLSVPWVYGKTGQPYVIPESLHSIPRLRVYRCDDEGPGTKALAPLRNPLLPEDCVLMFCDDDTYYRPETFALLADAIASSPVFVHSMCSPSIRGYLGFGGVKEVLLPVLSIEVPDECHTVDDTFFEEAFGRLFLLGDPPGLALLDDVVQLLPAELLPAAPLHHLRADGRQVPQESITRLNKMRPNPPQVECPETGSQCLAKSCCVTVPATVELV